MRIVDAGHRTYHFGARQDSAPTIAATAPSIVCGPVARAMASDLRFQVSSYGACLPTSSAPWVRKHCDVLSDVVDPDDPLYPTSRDGCATSAPVSLPTMVTPVGAEDRVAASDQHVRGHDACSPAELAGAARRLPRR